MRRALGLGIAVALVSSGCSANTSASSLDQLEHVHSVATDGEQVFLASHHGLYTWTEESWRLVGEEFDVMGLTIDDGVFYASGHPGPTQDLPNPLGILVSSDAGKTWTPESLTVEVDFHLLEAVGASRVGVAANYGAVVGSVDGGMTWSTLDIPSLTSMSLNPANGAEMLLVSEGLLYLSTDAGSTFQQTNAPLGIFTVEWSDTSIFVASDSALFQSSSAAGPFTALSEAFTNVSDMAAHGTKIIVMDDQGIHVSDNGGESFALLP